MPFNKMGWLRLNLTEFEPEKFLHSRKETANFFSLFPFPFGHTEENFSVKDINAKMSPHVHARRYVCSENSGAMADAGCRHINEREK